jgi:hypothetical protein
LLVKNKILVFLFCVSFVYVVNAGGGGIVVVIVVARQLSDGVDGNRPFARSRRGLPAAAAAATAAGDGVDGDGGAVDEALLSRRFGCFLSAALSACEPLDDDAPFAVPTDASDFDRPVLRRRGALRLGPRTARRNVRT